MEKATLPPVYGALAFSIGGYGYVGTGYNDNYLKDFYRFDPNAAAGQQWTIVSGFGGYKRQYGTAFVIDDVAYICCGDNNGTLVDDLWITRAGTVSFVIDGRGYIATGTRSGVTSDYWVYDPEEDLWYGDSDDDYTPMTNVHNVSSGGSSRSYAVSFSTGKRGFVLSGSSGTSYFDDVYELLPYEQEDVD